MEKREQKKKEWQKQIRREVHIMKSSPHVSTSKHTSLFRQIQRLTVCKDAYCEGRRFCGNAHT